MKAGAGFTTLAMSLLLLTVLSAWSLFIGKSMIAERRLTLNEIEYRLTHAAAEQGLAEAIAKLKVEPNAPSFASSLSTELGEVSYQVKIVDHISLLGIRQLESTASMPSGARSRVRLALAERTILNPEHAGPFYPLLLAGNHTAINGQLQIVAHQDNAHASSIWSAGSLSVNGGLYSCYFADYDGVTHSCLTSLSQWDVLEQRLEQDLRLTDSAFPADLLRYLFGYDVSQWRHLEALATAVVTDCSDITKSGFYIVSGGASCQLEQVVSSAHAPVILLVKNMKVVAHTPTQFYGLLVLQSTDTTQRSLSLANGSELVGGLIMGRGYEELNGDFTLRYHADTLCILSACQPTSVASPFRLLSIVVGSWHDD